MEGGGGGLVWDGLSVLYQTACSEEVERVAVRWTEEAFYKPPNMPEADGQMT